jgi:hypothetical protein
VDTLIDVLLDARNLVGRADDDIVRELDHHLDRVRRGVAQPWEISGLFLPTGALQEVALDNGWGDEYLALADRFDAIH